MGKALRIPCFFITYDYPNPGETVLSDPDDADTYAGITADEAAELEKFGKLLEGVCAKHYTRMDYPDGTFDESFEWWFNMADIDSYEKEVLNAKNLKVHPLVKLLEVLNFEIPLHGTLAKIISKGKWDYVTLNNSRHFADEYAQETNIFGDC